MNRITMTLQVDHLLLEALREDISSEDVTTNAVMKEAVPGEVELIAKQDGVALITADHGNADKMYEEDGSPFTAHTTNPVPFCVVGYPCKKLRKGGRLADIAPTMLQILGLPQPAEMDGRSLIEE